MKAILESTVCLCVVVGLFWMHHIDCRGQKKESFVPPKIIAHRGLSSIYPENTLLAFRKGLESTEVAELDVWLSKDGHLIVIHDRSIERTTNGTGKVDELTLEYLKTLDAGSWKGSQFAGQQIPTLDEVLAIFKGRGIVNIELKYPKKLKVPGFELEQKVLNLVNIMGMDKEVILSSFHHVPIERLAKGYPHLKTFLLFNEGMYHKLSLLGGITKYLAKYSVKGASFQHKLVSKKLVDKLHDMGLEVGTFTIDDRNEYERMGRTGVQYVFSNIPDMLHAI